MTRRRSLPYCPPSYPDELLSSWIARIGLFYGIDYFDVMSSLLPAAGLAGAEWTEDVETDAAVWDALVAWTGLRTGAIPRLLSRSDENLLEPAARLAYCPVCWDADVHDGRQPYARRSWVRWTTVTCAEHERWLSARQPSPDYESFMNDWGGIWRSKQTWAGAFGLRHDSALATAAEAFNGTSFDQPAGDWSEFESAAKQATGIGRNAAGSLFAIDDPLSDIVSSNNAALRRRVRAAMQIEPLAIRLDEFDLKGYRRPVPGWIANRIACIVIAVERDGIRTRRPPLFPRVRAFIEAPACVSAETSGLTITGILPPRLLGRLWRTPD